MPMGDDIVNIRNLMTIKSDNLKLLTNRDLIHAMLVGASIKF